MVEKNEALCSQDGSGLSPAAGSPSTARRIIAFVLEAAVVLGLIALLGRTPALPIWGVAVIWALLSAIAALGLTYQLVIRKARRQLVLEKGGALSKLNAGRIVGMIVSFVVSAVFIAGLVLEASMWETMHWCIAAASIPLFLLVAHLAGRFVGAQFTPLFRTPSVVLVSGAVTGALLIFVYLVVLLNQAPAEYATAAEAIAAARPPFADSASTLLAQAGEIKALLDGVAAYGISRAAQESLGVYVALRLLLGASAFIGLAGLLSTCYLTWSEARRIFLPLADLTGADPASQTPARPAARFVVAAIVLPLLLIGGYLAADHRAADVVATEEYTLAQQMARDAADLAVYVIDGAFYEQQQAQAVVEEARREWARLSQEGEDTLVPLVNAAYDARLANVDEFLDWYYSLPADYERLVQMVTGTVEEYVAEQFIASIEDGVDDSELAERYQAISDQRTAIEARLMEELAACQVTGVPEWLLKVEGALDLSFLDETPEPPQEWLADGTRFGASAAAGIGAGVVSKQLVKKMATKTVFKEIVARISSFLASRGIGAAAGGAVGTALGPVGTVIGVAVGTAAGIGVDYGLLKLDEAQNRDAYRQEIVDTIEESRSEMLTLVRDV